MAEGASLDNIKAEYRSRKENGRYIIPWGGNRPSNLSVFQWMFREKDNSGVGGTWKSFWRFKDEVLSRSYITYFLDSHHISLSS